MMKFEKFNNNTTVGSAFLHNNKLVSESGHRQGARAMKCAAFTLAEVLITLAVIGIVAVLTIPGIVKNHNEKAWAVGKKVFSNKLEVALRTMNTNSTVSGFQTTADFVNELKKYIKINNICTDDISKCFSKKVVWNARDNDPISITNNVVQYEDRDEFDWAETVGIQFSNGITALLAYNKNCSADPYNNTENISAKCVGIIYDVSGNKSPNQNGKDIAANANIKSLGGQSACLIDIASEFGGLCITKILSATNGEFSPISYNECVELEEAGYGIMNGCPGPWAEGDLSDEELERLDAQPFDYWGGALKACGSTDNMPNEEQSALIAQYIYNFDGLYIGGGSPDDAQMDMDKAAIFLEKANSTDSFTIWLAQDAGTESYVRVFEKNSTGDDIYMREVGNDVLAVCVSKK